MRKLLLFIVILFLVTGVFADPPIYIAFLWHMHQPIYYPGENVIETDNAGHFDYSVEDIHNQRWGPYTTWPSGAVQMGIDAGFEHFGSQVSFTGSLIENLNVLQANGNGNFSNWQSSWINMVSQTTSLGNPRLDLISIGYFHPLMGLIDHQDIRNQIAMHRTAIEETFGIANYSLGMFPPECAFSEEMIPALSEEGIEWVLIDNIHLERACENYPYTTTSNLYEANESDILNPDPGDWQQLYGLWTGSEVSIQWAHQPHYVKYINPETGEESEMIGVPASRYLGHEDGRGGFGALQYEEVMSQFEDLNTDDDHPILIVLHHDGDNYGGGSNSYYNYNFSNFVDWLGDNSDRFVCTTIQDYLEMFPPETGDYMNVEPGSWSGADNGDPEFKKWNGDPYGGYSPDRNSWGIITAAGNILQMARENNPGNSVVEDAYKMYLTGQTSCYWYWDGSQNGLWDSNPARASNLAVTEVLPYVSGTDNTPPTIYHPQREPYNPGSTEWNIAMTSDLTIWSYVYDHSGLQSVDLKYRIDSDGINSHLTDDNETYNGGNDVGNWIVIEMNEEIEASQTDPEPLYKADLYSADINDLSDVLLDYYIEAVDYDGNVKKSPIYHVYVGDETGGGGGGYGDVSWEPTEPENSDEITITVSNTSIGGYVHWGVNGFQQPANVYWTDDSYLYNNIGPAVETPMQGPDEDGNLMLTFGSFDSPQQLISSVDFVIHYLDGSWDNNNGQDYHITFSGGESFVIDGILDESAQLLADSGDMQLYGAFSETEIYVAANSAQQLGNDVFIFLGAEPGNMISAPWAKAGNVSDWDVFLGNESTNGWCGWFDHNVSALALQGSVLEGVISRTQWNNIESIYIAAAGYENSDGGELVMQAPAGNGNIDVEADEYYFLEFVAPFYGDVDGNGNIDSYDAAQLLQVFVGMITDWEEWQYVAGDVDGNGILEAYDASLILRFSVGLINSFPVEE